ncbi:Solute carrier 38 member [Perkinsus chesapeaki]|uniref:Solute carrier 38 member n=1 Tax=Perkinsus chesapeaki TaxID=330153 RepID=A0A7J6LUV4_PERCH|nr:Solute carrier 38 member [Perkinsus chesapeaki]
MSSNSTEGSIHDDLHIVENTTAGPLNDDAASRVKSASVRADSESDNASIATAAGLPADEDIAEENESPQKKMAPKKDTWASRTFAPGSPFTATIAVIKATLGGAILSNTYEMAIGGYVSAVVLLMVFAVLNVLSLDMIVKTVEKTGKTSYATIIEYLYGRKVLYGFQIAMVIFCLGSSASYLVTVVDSLAPLFNQLTIDEPHAWYHIMLTSRYYLSLIMLGVIMYPICLVKSLGSLRYLTIVSIMGIFWLAIVALYLLGTNGMAPDFNTGVYFLIAIPFLLVFGPDSKSSVLLNMADWIPQGDVVVIIGFIWMAISFIGTYPFMVYPVRVAMINTFQPKRADFWGVVVVTIAVIISYLIDIALPDVSILMGIVGAISGSILCFIAPGAFCVSISKSKKFFDKENWLYSGFVIWGCITLLGGTAISVYEIIEYAKGS